MAFQISLDIHRPPSDVFTLVADVRKMPSWYEAVKKVTVTTPGPSGTGTRFQMVRSLPGGDVHNDVEVTSFDLDKEITFRSVEGPTPFRYRYRFAPTAIGTRLTLEGEISGAGLRGVAGLLNDGLASELFKRGMKKNLQALKAVVEEEG
jgi:uncharacterized membrane protein